MTSTSTPRLLQIAVARVETKLTENGVQAFRYALWRKVYRKLVEQDMSYFEMKFTKPREANRLLMSQTGQFQRIISQVLRMVGEVSRLVTSAVYLLQSNRPLFLVMLVTTPATLLANEGFEAPHKVIKTIFARCTANGGGTQRRNAMLQVLFPCHACASVSMVVPTGFCVLLPNTGQWPVGDACATAALLQPPARAAVSSRSTHLAERRARTGKADAEQGPRPRCLILDEPSSQRAGNGKDGHMW